MQTNILEYLEATVLRLPDKIAYSNGKEGLTFRELFQSARAVGSALLSMGCSHEPIAILMEKHPREVAAFFGVVYAGCFYVPLDTEMPTARMETILESVGAKLLIVDQKGKKIANSLHFPIKTVDYEEIAESSINEAALSEIRLTQIDTDPIYIVFTSGSTGVPKGVIACHRSVIDYIETLSPSLGFSEDTVFANQTPLFFDAPLKELMPVIKFGATAYLLPRTLFMFPMMLCNFLNEYRINTVCWVVSALTMISSLGLLEKNLPKYLKTVAFGSEVFPKEQYRLWREALPEAKFYNLYGPTGATGMSGVCPAERALGENEAIPIGRPFKNTDLLLIKEDGTRAGVGEVGEIYLRGTCVTHGYYRNPEKTAESFVQNPLQHAYPETVYRTGDLAFQNEYGEYVFVSRKDAQIKHMGHRIELGEIEAASSKCEGITRACCVYDQQNKRIVLYYTGKTETPLLLNELKQYLPRYMIPTLCISLPAMPLTPNGKLDRKLLKERAQTEAEK